MKLLVIALNLVGWPIIQLSLSSLFLRLPDALFAADNWLTRERSLEQGGEIYRRYLLVQRWKGLLPDGASWLGGRAKKNVASRSFAELTVFAIETRRAELAHWCMLLCAPIFYLWNPLWACCVMTLYGIAANLPCILVQRANRIKVDRLLRRFEMQTHEHEAAIHSVAGS
ncbi:glycosyl-4,4'-diaponeurosporenoate acyltransferase [Occallatibacter savannae]|uniref:glycosyl-4,4'-diaponeurosporenoate acyltransferase CrtO family protein n=1 Tax=Occallatibacter savannae TaxID=1002691 RepID=UPI000D691550|nr:glycosyl-4,4'-diaponeurosporenoate acyltransferase [Occallatibacter savannae]